MLLNPINININFIFMKIEEPFNEIYYGLNVLVVQKVIPTKTGEDFKRETIFSNFSATQGYYIEKE